jgi:hypothetical protein
MRRLAARAIGRLLRILPGRPSPILSHAIAGRGMAVPYVIVPNRAATPRDVEIAGRLLRAYRLARECFGPDMAAKESDLWSYIAQSQGQFFAVLDRGDPERLAAYLCNMCRHDATTGIIQGDLEHRRIIADVRYRRFLATMTKDKLLLLAEAVGAIAPENPEQGPWGQAMHLDLDTIAAEIERAVGIDFIPPDIDGGLLKIRSARALFNERDVSGLYTAWHLRTLLAPQGTVCEIGGGTGRVAYWSWRLGPRSYTILDLPHVNVVQGYYVLRTLPEALITLFGETLERGDATQIRILPAFALEECGAGAFDLVLNQDSFPEIGRQSVLRYLELIKVVSRRHFLSINHESRPESPEGGRQLSVPELVQECGGYRRISRTPFWLRKGYVMELYEVDKPT